MDRPTSTPTDHELALRVSDGQDWAYEELLHRHGDLIELHTRLINGAAGESHDDFMQAAKIGLLKAARTYTASRGSSFRHFASLAIRSELITTLVKARRGKHQVLNESGRLEAPISAENPELLLGDIVPAPGRDEPLAALIRQEELAALVARVQRCTLLERKALAMLLNGQPFSHHKSIDNALQRARRKLAA